MAYWGVDTCAPATQSLLDTIEQQAGGIPFFWGRYLTNNNVCPNGALTPTEVSFLHQKGIKILLIVNDWPLSQLGSYTQGQQAANHCIAVAKNNVNGVQVPQYGGYAIFLDIEGFNPSYDWFQGFADAFASAPYIGGIYGNQDNFGSNLCLALNGDPHQGIPGDNNVLNLYIWGNQPITGWTTYPNQPNFNPHSLPCRSIAVWQYALSNSTHPYDEDLAQAMTFMW